MSALMARLALLDPCRFQKPHHSSAENVAAILADLREGSGQITNPIHVVPKGGGRYEIVAGHDRTEAMRQFGGHEIPARDMGSLLITGEQIYAHWRRDNVLRKQPDRMEAAEECLLDWAGAWSDRRVATVCGVSPSTVGTIRKRLETDGRLSKLDTRIGADERSYRPRQVRANVPSGRPIPHPTAKVEVKANPPQGAGEREAPGADEAPRLGVEASTEHAATGGVRSGPSGVGDTPTGAPVPGWITENTNDSAGAVPDRLTSDASDDGLEDSPDEGRSQSDYPVSPPEVFDAVGEEVSGGSLGVRSDALGAAGREGVGVPVWVIGALEAPAPAPLTEAQAAALTIEQIDGLLSRGIAYMNAAKRARIVHEKHTREAA